MSIIRVTAKATKPIIEALDRVRLRRGLTYVQLAAEIGLSPRNFYRLMTDRRASLRDTSLYRMRAYLEAQGEPLDEPIDAGMSVEAR